MSIKKKLKDLWPFKKDDALEVDDVTAEFLRMKLELYRQGKLELVPWPGQEARAAKQKPELEQKPPHRKFNL